MISIKKTALSQKVWWAWVMDVWLVCAQSVVFLLMVSPSKHPVSLWQFGSMLLMYLGIIVVAVYFVAIHDFMSRRVERLAKQASLYLKEDVVLELALITKWNYVWCFLRPMSTIFKFEQNQVHFSRYYRSIVFMPNKLESEALVLFSLGHEYGHFLHQQQGEGGWYPESGSAAYYFQELDCDACGYWLCRQFFDDVVCREVLARLRGSFFGNCGSQYIAAVLGNKLLPWTVIGDASSLDDARHRCLEESSLRDKAFSDGFSLHGVVKDWSNISRSDVMKLNNHLKNLF